MRAWGLMFLIACAADPIPTPAPKPAEEPSYDAHWQPVDSEGQGQGWARAEEIPMGQRPRRLEVDHLRRSIPRLFGGIQWLDVSGQPMWDRLSRTLGEADYREVTEDDVEPTPLFAKFMDDMAAQVCRKAIDYDARQTDSSRRLVTRHMNDINENIRWLQLKIHGRISPPEGDEGLAAYRRLHDELMGRTGQSDTAWLGVCMAMLTAPEFLAY